MASWFLSEKKGQVTSRPRNGFPKGPKIEKFQDRPPGLIISSEIENFKRAATLQKCGSEFFLRFSLPKVSWNLAWNFDEIFRATFSRVWVCDGKFHQNFTSKTARRTENFTQISLCWGAALKFQASHLPNPDFLWGFLKARDWTFQARLKNESRLKITIEIHFFNLWALRVYIGPAPLQKVVGDFCCINFGGFCKGFCCRISLCTLSPKNEEKNPQNAKTEMPTKNQKYKFRTSQKERHEDARTKNEGWVTEKLIGAENRQMRPYKTGSQKQAKIQTQDIEKTSPRRGWGLQKTKRYARGKDAQHSPQKTLGQRDGGEVEHATLWYIYIYICVCCGVIWSKFGLLRGYYLVQVCCFFNTVCQKHYKLGFQHILFWKKVAR